MNNGFSVPQWCKVFEELHDKQMNHFWRPPTADKFSKDRSDWLSFPLAVKKPIKGVVHVVARVEPQVMKNISGIAELAQLVLDEETLEELLIMFIMLDMQKAMEGIHTRSYVYIDDVLEIKDNDVGEGFHEFVAAKTHMVGKYRNVAPSKKALTIAIIANIFSEAFFNNQFALIGYLRKDGYLPQTTITNEEILYDENLHTESFVTMHNILTQRSIIPRISPDEMRAMTLDFISIEDKAIEWIYGNMDADGQKFFLSMNEENAKIYTRILANSVLKAIGYASIYAYTPSDNPFPWMDQTLLNTLTSFFDKDVSEYSLKVDYPIEYESDPE